MSRRVRGWMVKQTVNGEEICTVNPMRCCPDSGPSGTAISGNRLVGMEVQRTNAEVISCQINPNECCPVVRGILTPCCPGIELPRVLCLKLRTRGNDYTGTLIWESGLPTYEQYYSDINSIGDFDSGNFNGASFLCVEGGASFTLYNYPFSGSLTSIAIDLSNIISCDPFVMKMSWAAGFPIRTYQIVIYECAYSGDIGYPPLPSGF